MKWAKVYVAQEIGGHLLNTRLNVFSLFSLRLRVSAFCF